MKIKQETDIEPTSKMPSSRVAGDFPVSARRDEEGVASATPTRSNAAGRENIRNPSGYGESSAIAASLRARSASSTPSPSLLAPQEDSPVSRPKVSLMWVLTQRISRARKTLALGVLFVVFGFVIGAGFTLTHAFTGPGSNSAGTGSGAIGSNAANNVSVGTSTPVANTKFVVAASSTDTSNYALRVTKAGDTPVFLIRNDGSIAIASTSFSAGNILTVQGTILSTGGFTGSLDAGSITAAMFGSGNFGFQSGLAINTSTNVGLPATLSVYGGVYSQGGLSSGSIYNYYAAASTTAGVNSFSYYVAVPSTTSTTSAYGLYQDANGCCGGGSGSGGQIFTKWDSTNYYGWQMFLGNPSLATTSYKLIVTQVDNSSPVALFQDVARDGTSIDANGNIQKVSNSANSVMAISGKGNGGVTLGGPVVINTGATGTVTINGDVGASVLNVPAHDNTTDKIAVFSSVNENEKVVVGFDRIWKGGSASNTPFYVDATGTGALALQSVAPGSVQIGLNGNTTEKLKVNGNAVIVGQATTTNLTITGLAGATGCLSVSSSGAVTTSTCSGGSGITSLNGLSGASQTFSTSTALASGFDIRSSGTVHTLYLANSLSQLAGLATTTGNIIVGNTANGWSTLGVGTNGKVLTASSTATNGVSWEPASGASLSGGTANWIPMWTGASTLGTSTLLQNGVTTYTMDGFAIGTSTTQTAGNIFVTGSYLGGTIAGSKVNADVFGAGNFSFPSSLGINTSTNASIPAALSVYGSGYFTGGVSSTNLSVTGAATIATSTFTNAPTFTDATGTRANLGFCMPFWDNTGLISAPTGSVVYALPKSQGNINQATGTVAGWIVPFQGTITTWGQQVYVSGTLASAVTISSTLMKSVFPGTTTATACSGSNILFSTWDAANVPTVLTTTSTCQVGAGDRIYMAIATPAVWTKPTNVTISNFMCVAPNR